MHMTRLHKQIVNRVGLIVIALAFLVTASCIGFMSWLYLKTDAEQVSAELTKVELLLQNERDGLSRAVNDYAVWDDAYDYVSKPNRKFETDNFTQQSLNVMQLDFVAIMAAPGKTLFSSEINPADSNITATPAIHTPLLWSLLAKLPDWQQRNGEKMQSTYLTAANGRPLLLAVSGIFDSSLEQPHNGLMIFGRYLDGTYLQRLQQLAESQLQISAQMPVQKITAPLYHTEQTVSKRLASWQTPEIWLQVSKDVNWQQRYLMMALFALGLLLVLLFTSWVLQHLLNRLVVERIETFAELASRRTQGERVYWPVEGQNELDLLARTFNELMDEVQAAHKNMHDLSITDTLTALGNRRGMEEQVSKMMKTCQLGTPLSMLLMDLDGFKLINDSLGHAAGDLLLQEVAQRMRQVMRRQDKLFRMGGDEFAVLMPHTTAEQGHLLAERLIETLVAPIHFGQHRLSVSGSVGVAQWDGETDGLELMRHADLAMYAAKRDGKSCVRLFEKGMSGVASERMTLEQELRRAIAEQSIEPHFQPVIDTGSGNVVAVEMLARWRRNNELVSPLGFIRLAEDLGLINQLSMQLLDQGLTALCHFRQHYPELKLQINISPLQFADRHLALTMLQAVAAYDLPSTALAVELTEGAMLLYPEQVEQTMLQFVEAGVSLHLDDFGTGYSSLARLRDLPFDTVKLDRSFVVMLGEGDTTLSQAVFDMATSLHMDLIAEGVENQTEYEELQAIGYRQMQGYMFARPMPETALIQWLQAHAAA
ncbi:MAG: EAL domain-containing protein [Gammaproteobacteria bacterium]|nr:EAL domain-containing protein [Gammaproteobacteria bacterium]